MYPSDSPDSREDEFREDFVDERRMVAVADGGHPVVVDLRSDLPYGERGVWWKRRVGRSGKGGGGRMGTRFDVRRLQPCLDDVEPESHMSISVCQEERGSLVRTDRE